MGLVVGCCITRLLFYLLRVVLLVLMVSCDCWVFAWQLVLVCCLVCCLGFALFVFVFCFRFYVWIGFLVWVEWVVYMVVCDCGVCCLVVVLVLF